MTAAHAAARQQHCTICQARPGTPCQTSPEGDHLQRYVDAYTCHHINRGQMAAVFAQAEVITRYRIITAAAA